MFVTFVPPISAPSLSTVTVSPTFTLSNSGLSLTPTVTVVLPSAPVVWLISTLLPLANPSVPPLFTEDCTVLPGVCEPPELSGVSTVMPACPLIVPVAES